DEIVQTIAVDIREVAGHREMWNAPQGIAGNGTKMSMAVAEPKAVGILKIIAGIEVRFAVLIDIMHYDAEAQVPGSRSQSRARFIEECAVGPGHFAEATFAVIEVKGTRLAVLNKVPFNNLQPITIATDDLLLATNHPRGDSHSGPDRIFPIV